MRELQIKKDDTNVFAISFVDRVKEYLNDIKYTFFLIGFRLTEAYKMNYVEQLGYDNIVDLAQDLFDFEKSTTYNLMKIYDNFHDEENKTMIDRRYKDYSQSQLIEIMRSRWARDSLLKKISPSDSCRNIRKYISYWNKYSEYHSMTPDISCEEYIRSEETKENGFVIVEDLKVHAVPEDDGIYIEEETVSETFAEDPKEEIKESIVNDCEDVIEEKDMSKKPSEDIAENPAYKTTSNNGKYNSIFLGSTIYNELQVNGIVPYSTENIKNDGTMTLIDDLKFILFLRDRLSKDKFLKENFVDVIFEEFLNRYDYKITLCGRVQNKKVFAKSLSNVILERLF